jgi:cytochrome c oxidase assembly protein subunit 17
MSNNDSKQIIPEENTERIKNTSTKKLSPCCVCKETKTLRDECLRFKSDLECLKEIDNHKQCLIDNGFKV